MIALGIVLIIISGTFALGVALSNTTATQAEAFGVSLSNVTLGGLFLAGIVTGAALLIGVTLLLAGIARQRHRRRAAVAQVKAVTGESATLAEQNTRLQEELAQQRHQPVVNTPYPQEGLDAPGTDDQSADSRGTQTRKRPGLFDR